MIFHCCDQNRRAAVDAHATLNGIDWLEVLDLDAPLGSPRQRTLLVRLLKPVPAGLTREFAVALTLVLDRSVVRPGTATEFPSPDPALILQRRTDGHADVRVVATGEQLFSAGTRRRRTDLVTWP